ncbi:MAG: maleylpyruvate isomerase family mycothiol-dependent enzyme [Acidimicrobiia bacterium]
MALQYVDVIRAESERIVAALQARRDGPIPWCGEWTVQDCAQHVGGAHHVVANVIAGRPTADFGFFRDLVRPRAADPGLAGWLAEGTATLVEQLRGTDADAETWSWWPAGRNAAFWARRMAHETLVHRWDAERGAGLDPAPMDPVLAADGVDEYLEVFATLSRHLGSTPGAGESAQIRSTDTGDRWSICFPADGSSELTRGDGHGDVSLSGPAEGLLLLLWGRSDERAAGVEVAGDSAVWSRWRELVPPM